MTDSMENGVWNLGTIADESWRNCGHDLVVLAQVDRESAREFEAILGPRLRHGAEEPKASALEKIIRRDPDLAERCARLTDGADLVIVDRNVYRDQVWERLKSDFDFPTAAPPPLKLWLDPFVELHVNELMRCDSIPQRLVWEMTAGWGVPIDGAADIHHPFKLNLLTARQNASLCEVFDQHIEIVCAERFKDRRFWSPGQVAAEVTLIAQQRGRLFDDGQSWTLPLLQRQRATLDTLAACLAGHSASQGVGAVVEHRSFENMGIQLADLAASRGRKLYECSNRIAELKNRPGRVTVNGSQISAFLQAWLGTRKR